MSRTCQVTGAHPSFGHAISHSHRRTMRRWDVNIAPGRVRNRDSIDGRPRGHVGKVGLSRVNMRTAAHRGELPGITKSSW